ncbi:MAG: carboxylating nicotinate-nucleotide diphosphorylase [Candidatus Lokiarchaeota archaeon]
MRYNKVIIERKIREFLEEDCSFDDVSSKFISNDSKITAKIICKNSGYVSGLEEIELLFNILGVEIEIKKDDGEKVLKGDIIAIINGYPREILLGERVALNILTHMSALTTSTRYYLEIIDKAAKKTKIACTRKTLPGLRIFEKKAVEMGGGDTHRFSLDDMILLKDTHLRYYNGDIKRLLDDVNENASFSKKIEIEVENANDALIAAQKGADIIMLDNMSPKKVKEAISLLKAHNLREKVIIEISGGINIENIISYVECEPDIISTSEITQFPPKQVDFSLRFV